MKKILAILLIISIFLFPSCASPTSSIDVPPVDGKAYDWTYVKTYAEYEIKFFGSEDARAYYAPAIRYSGGNVQTRYGYFQYIPLRTGHSYIYNKRNITIGGNWEVTHLD